MSRYILSQSAAVSRKETVPGDLLPLSPLRLLHFPSVSTRLWMNSNSFNKEFLSALSEVYKETSPFAFIKYSGSQSGLFPPRELISRFLNAKPHFLPSTSIMTHARSLPHTYIQPFTTRWWGAFIPAVNGELSHSPPLLWKPLQEKMHAGSLFWTASFN